jgi:hypothetical protein
MIREQGGTCPICLMREAVAVDHDHHNGSVRAILCSQCNAALGHLFDDPIVIRRAAQYLDEWKEKHRGNK